MNSWSTRPDTKTDLILRGLDCAIEDSSGIYASIPIQAGRRLFTAMARHNVRDQFRFKNEYHEAFISEVVEPNVSHGRKFIKEARRRFSRPIIDPSQLGYGVLHENAFHTLWTKVITEKVSDMLMAGGWEYSPGCISEYKLAHSLNKRIYDSSYKKLSRSSATALIIRANERITKMGFDLEAIQSSATR